MMISVIFLIGGLRSSGAIIVTLFFTMMTFGMLAIFFLTGEIFLPIRRGFPGRNGFVFP